MTRWAVSAQYETGESSFSIPGLSNIARDARVSVSSNYDVNQYPKENISDGRFDIKDNRLRWVSSASELPDYITFSWSEPRTISSMRIISGWFDGTVSKDPIRRFTLQYHCKSDWEDIRGLRIIRHTPVEAIWTFPAIRSNRMRLVVTDTPGNISRIWEVEFYHPAAKDKVHEPVR